MQQSLVLIYLILISIVDLLCMQQRMLPAFHQSCNEMITEWKSLVPKQGSSCELDVWPSLQNLTPDVISRTAFGSSYHEGKKIFVLLKEQMIYTIQTLQSVYIPGWR